MRYEVLISRQAEYEMAEVYRRIHKAAPMTAPRWFAQLEAAIYSLAQMPERCPLAPEGMTFKLDIRQLIFGKRQGAFRILFYLDGNYVRVLHVVRGARKFLSQDDF